ncbi:hypothetical protein WJX75_000265 [Coccomyxa subellipsoidea]|uniref:Proteasome assembly chaperone 2 n=1 Tax=Coccomyxa subellipsoidea TaxID=248742 RepID=A0ABR2YRU7_9CHLO
MEAKVNCDEAFFRGKLLLLPAEGTGNVGQLAVDLFIYNTRLENLGSLRAPSKAFDLDASSWQELEDKDPHGGTPYIDQHLPPFHFFRAAKARGLPACLLLMPVNEGDNSLDSKALASAAAETLGHPETAGEKVKCSSPTWHVPPSWLVFGQQRVVY